MNPTFKKLMSALIAGGVIGITSKTTGSTTGAAVLLGVLAALKDLQAYLATPPDHTEETKNATPPVSN